jgi:hypothetical protein
MHSCIRRVLWFIAPYSSQSQATLVTDPALNVPVDDELA